MKRLQPHLLTGSLLLVFLLSAVAAEPWYIVNAPVIGPQNQRIRCNPREKSMIQPMRPLLRKLLLSMVSLQLCKDHARSALCTSPPSKFQRHHHCQLMSLLQRSAKTCANKLLCKHTTSIAACSSAWQSNVAALQWLFPRHAYCSSSQVEKVPAKSSGALFT